MKKLGLTPEIRGLFFSEDDITTAVSQDRPLLLTLYTKGICNAKCPSCFITSEDSKYNELSLEEYLDIISEASRMGIKSIKFSGAGEPLITPNFINILEACNRGNIIPVVYTNGSILGDDILANKIYNMTSLELIDMLYELNATIIYKCNSMSSSVQDYLLGVKGMSEYTYRGLLNLLFKGYNVDNRLALQTIITPYNLSETKELYAFARRNNIIPYFETVLIKGEAGENKDLYLEKNQIKDIFMTLCKMDREEFDIDWFPVPTYVNFQCTELGYGILVDNFGYGRFCPGIWESFGNIRSKKTLFNLWKDKKAVAFRIRIKASMEGKCKNCSYKSENKCGYGCRAYAYLNDGDIYGEYKECWW